MKNKKQERKAQNKFYGYVRGSNDGVNKENQRKAILAVAKNRGIKVELTEITMSATKKISSRGVNSLIARCNKGDTILVSEVARLARDVHELLGISKECRERGVSLEILNPPMVLDGSMMSNALVTILGMVAEMEKNTMSLRIKQSLEGKKSDLARQGYFFNKAGEKCFSLGAPKGKPQALALEAKRDEVLKYKEMGLNMNAMAKLLGVSRHSVKKFLARFPIVNGKYKD